MLTGQLSQARRNSATYLDRARRRPAHGVLIGVIFDQTVVRRTRHSTVRSVAVSQSRLSR